MSTFKVARTNSKEEKEPSPPPRKETKEAKEVVRKEPVVPKEIKKEVAKEVHIKPEKLTLAAESKENEKINGVNKKINTVEGEQNSLSIEKSPKNDENVGVGDKIKKFEKAAEDASGTAGRLSRPGSVRRRAERLGSDGKDDFPPPPATPFRDTFEPETTISPPTHNPEKQKPNHVKWQKSTEEEKQIKKPEPQKIIKPEFKPMQSPIDVTIRSPSLGAKISEQFQSHGTAFRNVALPDVARNSDTKEPHNDVNTQNNYKACKLKSKEKYSASVSKGSSYFTRGSEEIWLVKKKDIEEIEERVLDSFRRAGGNLCMRNEARPSSDSGQGASFSHTMGRNKRQMYARSESLDPQWAGARAQTLKRQTSVACTCGHDKKPRAKSACDAPPRTRSRSHGDDNNSQHVLDKYETLV